MPRKRKGSNLSTVSREGRRSQQRRRIENLEERLQRQEADAQRHAQQRLEENDEERCRRQEADAQRHAQHRFDENDQERCRRQEADAQRHAQQRLDENDEERSRRQEADAQRHDQRRRQGRELNYHLALIDKGNEINVPVHKLGKMNVKCQFCKSLNFACEKPKDGKFTYCCQKGKLQLEPINLPDFLRKLYMGNDNLSKNFRDNIRSYNSALAMASMGAPSNRNPIDVVTLAPYCLKIHGQYHHLTSTAMRPGAGQAPRYAQLYFLDTEEAVHYRINNEANQGCDQALMKALSVFMVKNNKLAKTFKMMREVERDLNPRGTEVPNLMLSFRNDPQQDQRRYNAPRANEIAVVFQNVDGEPPFERDIRIYNKNSNDVQQISILDRRCDSMCYPLLYPYGNDGWHSELKTNNPKYPGFKVTQMDYYAHLLAPRAEFSHFQRAGKLRCQFILDAYMKTEANRINYIKMNQPQIRAELYSGLMDHLHNRAQNEGITAGIPVILPSSFMGSPRICKKDTKMLCLWLESLVNQTFF
ncbi:PREDICTED: uncharacterized protein LOC105556155 [Vollenhovia emeryi]|uniref:uncharacterized protein LOC105556155 n=1 Tax=Vollenhovia emeryi TaxID=411798 RepID=UPI0005F504B1|nr:PREDICTED: uncharacterized protein LOC105556155 [Vollenhovia emeryi]